METGRTDKSRIQASRFGCRVRQFLWSPEQRWADSTRVWSTVEGVCVHRLRVRAGSAVRRGGSRPQGSALPGLGGPFHLCHDQGDSMIPS